MSPMSKAPKILPTLALILNALPVVLSLTLIAFSANGNTKMLKVIIDIAETLSVPMIAEGVETEEQLRALKEMGCDIVQGYYFSRPVPAAEFETFMAKAGKAEG